MAISPRTRALALVDPDPEQPYLPPVEVDLTTEADGPTLEDGALKTEQSDGSVVVDFSPDLSKDKNDKGDFYRNIASEIDSSKLAGIASDLMDGINADEQSRKDWIDTRAKGIKLLGLVLEDPQSSTASAPLEGMSTIRHPALLEATVRFQATAGGELLPSSGPVKVRNDTPNPPEQKSVVGIGHNGGPPIDAAAPAAPASPAPPASMGQPPVMPPMAGAPPVQPGMPPGMPVEPPPLPGTGTQVDELASALEKDWNHYLTVTATEYIPDTDRMLFYVGFGGTGIKKVYNCPLRRRVVSESVDPKDFIVSNAVTDMYNCARITHKIRMRPSVLKRMQILGAYRDVQLNPPNPSPPQNQVEQAESAITGQKKQSVRTADADYDVYEVYCELDLDEFAPVHFKGKGLPLPYVVTLEHESQQILCVRRNWKEEDRECLAKRYFVEFPFIRGLGFYGLGLLHILGNTTAALTASWREMLDAGMFANFPGFLHAKAVGRQNTNQFRVPPGGGVSIDLAGLTDIRQAVMPLPYKEVGPSFAAFVKHIEEVAQRLGQTAEIAVGEGKQDAPVGTTLALIEQATKVIDAVHKRLHGAQAQEFQLLRERFLEDPEAFWRHNKQPTMRWQREQFVAALHNYNLVPVADPNNPTSLHRVAKAVALLQLAQSYQQQFDIRAVLKRIFRIVGLDPEGLFLPTPAPPPPDPRFEAIKQKAMSQERMAQIQEKLAVIKAATEHDRLQDKVQERVSRERIETMRLINEALDLEQSRIIHAKEAERDEVTANIDAYMDMLASLTELHATERKHRQGLAHQQDRHEMDLARQDQRHEQQMRHGDQQHEARLDQIRAQSRAKPEKSS